MGLSLLANEQLAISIVGQEKVKDKVTAYQAEENRGGDYNPKPGSVPNTESFHLTGLLQQNQSLGNTIYSALEIIFQCL